ncbi:MAG: hypothetical protein M1839_008038 [Geoglossum umbratile]|nr:MAG: hypothetical protein M1839_008038 [Geoglossum umbratile]
MKCGSFSDDAVGELSSRLSSLSCTTVIYAELLLNIRQVSIFVSLPTPSSPETRVELSSDRLSFIITHDGQISLLQLPAKVAEVPPLRFPPTPNRELSFRLPLDHTARQATHVNPDNVVPWAANSLSEVSAVSCRKCGGTLVGAGAVKMWKDLPSENWAEMMEFWHCHKPIEHGHPAESNYVGKGYTASEKITAMPGLGLVDLCYFLLSEQDCYGAKAATQATTKKQPQALVCAACQAIVGAVDERAEGWRLYKWSLAVQSTEDANVERFPTEAFVSAHLLALIENQGARKFIIRTEGEGGDSPINLCVFNTDLHYSIPTPLSSGPQRAMKVFYQELDNAAIDQHNNIKSENVLSSPSSEEVYLPLHIHQELLKRLHESNQSLPAPARKYQQWDIGLLERFRIGV